MFGSMVVMYFAAVQWSLASSIQQVIGDSAGYLLYDSLHLSPRQEEIQTEHYAAPRHDYVWDFFVLRVGDV